MALPSILQSFWGRLYGMDRRGGIVVNAFGRQGRLPLVLEAPVAASTAVTNTTSETAFDKKITVPKNTLHAGSVVRIKFQGIATSTNSTDTLQIKLYIGGTGGTALLTGTATDVADNNIFAGQFDIIIRTNGSSGTFVGFGSHTKVPAASNTATLVVATIGSTTIDTTADQDVVVSATWGAQSASDSCRLDFLTVEIV